MYHVRFLYTPETPQDPGSIKTRVLMDRHFNDEFLTPEDKSRIEENWKVVLEETKGKATTAEKSLGSLVDTQDGMFTYIPTEFKVYCAAPRSHKTRNTPAQTMSNQFYENLRISATSGVMRFIDDHYIVHRRGPKVTHCANMFDSSVGGFFRIENGELQYMKGLHEKLARETKVKPEDVKEIKYLGNHTSDNPDYSGVIDFRVLVNLEHGQIKERIDPNYFSECKFPHAKELPEFIYQHYAVENSMIGDGAAALLLELPHQDFLETVERIKKAGKVIQFGTLVDSKFVESA